MGMLVGGFYSQGGGGVTKKLDTTITYGSAVVYQSTKEVVTDLSTYIVTFDYTGTGYDGGSDYFAYGPGFGSIGTGTYSDAGSTSRLVDSCYFVEGTSLPQGEDRVMFVLDTTSVPNTDTVFKYIVIGTTQYNRADAFYTASVDGGTAWTWFFTPSATNPFTGGSVAFEVWCE